VPPSILASKTLRKLDLSRNYLSGEIDIPEGGLSNCLILVMGFNNLVASGSFSERLFAIPKILAIDFTSNPTLGQGIHENIGKQSQLEVLRMSSCGLEGPLPAAIAKTKLFDNVTTIKIRLRSTNE
jgi:Leucine-rich repeat (LRR) protein